VLMSRCNKAELSNVRVISGKLEKLFFFTVVRNLSNLF
jgi:hypothetical protein